MSLDGDRLLVGNRNAALPAAVITQAAGSTQPALSIGGNLSVSGSINGVATAPGTPGIGQFSIAASASKIGRAHV